jgi:hypothetical protein
MRDSDSADVAPWFGGRAGAAIRAARTKERARPIASRDEACDGSVPRTVTALVALVALAVLIGHSLAAAPGAATSTAACGTERWTVKTLQDRPRLIPTRDTTIAYLTSRPAPSSLPDTRLPSERHIYRVRADVTLVRPEDDSDLHVVLEDATGRTMITESPLPVFVLRERLRSDASRWVLLGRRCESAPVLSSPASPSSTSSTDRPVSRRTRLSCTRYSASAA